MRQEKQSAGNEKLRWLSRWTRLGKRFFRSRTWVLVFVIIIVFSLTSAGVFLFEQHINQDFHSLSDAVWWTIVTAATVGYGDKVPETVGGRVTAVLVMIVGIALVSIVTGRIASWLVEWKIREGRGLTTQRKLKGHIVICGWKHDMGALLTNVLKVNPGLTSADIVLVSMAKPAKVENIRSLPELRNAVFVRGDYVDEAVLHRANIKEAAKALVLADQDIDASPQEIDSRTVMVVLTIKAISRDIYTCAELIDSKFERYLQGVHCDEVFLCRHHNRMLLANATSAAGISQVLLDLLDIEHNRLVTKEFPRRYVGDTFASLGRYFMEAEKGILIGILENTGNIYQRKREALRTAQKTPDISRLVVNLHAVKKLQGNQAVINPGPDYQIKPYSRAILIRA
ncbi:MAG: ion transporter [Desulfobacterales bacterium]|nr:ion transporter [Desulfobacterales bacterium]